VGNVREWLFTPRLKFNGFNELNDWLARRCHELAGRRHPAETARTVADCLAEEQPLLRPVTAAFDGLSRAGVAGVQHLPGPCGPLQRACHLGGQGGVDPACAVGGRIRPRLQIDGTRVKNHLPRTVLIRQKIPCSASIAEIAVLERHRTGLEGGQNTRQGRAKNKTLHHVKTLGNWMTRLHRGDLPYGHPGTENYYFG